MKLSVLSLYFAATFNFHLTDKEGLWFSGTKRDQAKFSPSSPSITGKSSILIHNFSGNRNLDSGEQNYHADTEVIDKLSEKTSTRPMKIKLKGKRDGR